MPTMLERIGVVAGNLTKPGAAYLDFTDAALSSLVQGGDSLVLLVAATTVVNPSGWDRVWTSATWQAWTRQAATDGEVLPGSVEVNATGADPAGVLLVYRGATTSYVFGDHQAATSSAGTSHATAAVTVVDANGLRLGAWLGPTGGQDVFAPAGSTELVTQETSGAVGGAARWFVVAEDEIDAVPTASGQTATSAAAEAMAMASINLRDRPPYQPALLVDSGAGANIGLLP